MVDELRDLTPFWGAVAQIVPVLVLAMVLEARLLAERLTKKSRKRERDRLTDPQRARLGIWMGATWLLLFSVFGGAVLFLAFFAESTEKPSLGMQVVVYLAVFALVNGLAFVAYTPINRIAAALTVGGLAPWLHRSSEDREARRHLVILRDRFVASRQRAVKLRSRCVGMAASAQVAASVAERELNALTASGKDDVTAREKRRQLADAVDAADAGYDEFIAVIQAADAEIAECDEIAADLDRLEHSVELSAKQRIKLAAMVTDRQMRSA